MQSHYGGGFLLLLLLLLIILTWSDYHAESLCSRTELCAEPLWLTCMAVTPRKFSEEEEEEEEELSCVQS
jgi:hypothetical protein